MARPKKEKELLHNHQIMLRLTDTEYEIVAAKAKDANLPLAEYVRKQVLNKKIIAKYEIVADLPELKKLIAEFGKIGSNLNQIARYLNEYGAPYNALSSEVRAAVSDLAALKFEVLKVIGEAYGNDQAYQL